MAVPIYTIFPTMEALFNRGVLKAPGYDRLLWLALAWTVGAIEFALLRAKKIKIAGGKEVYRQVTKKDKRFPPIQHLLADGWRIGIGWKERDFDEVLSAKKKR
jgi:hypothetical protein